MTWEIIESAPKDGTRIVCWAAEWEHPRLLVWKENPRIVAMHSRGDFPDLVSEYFGDPEEYDDYELAESGGGPTHWHPLAVTPNVGDERRAL